MNDEWMGWRADDDSVMGHLCEGLKKFQTEATGCAPSISEDGTVSGCDADNSVPIQFCPWCGVQLRDLEAERREEMIDDAYQAARE